MKRLSGHILLLSALLLFCSNPVDEPGRRSSGCTVFTSPDAPFSDPPSTASIRYIITIPDTVHTSPLFTCIINSGYRFLLPVHYADNPLQQTNGPVVRDLHITEHDGQTIQPSFTTVTVGPQTNTEMILPDDVAYPVTVTYSIDFSTFIPEDDSKSMPATFCNDTAFFFTGAHCFIIPEISLSLADLWRTPLQSEIVIHKNPVVKVFGIPGTAFSCPTLYELLFLQFSHGAPVLTCGNGGGVDFIFTNFTATPWSAGLADSTAGLFAMVLDTLSRTYGSFSHYAIDPLPYTLAVYTLWGALEGTFGFAVREPFEGTDGRFCEILAHEALHHFIGIRCGDLDDPWWKEAAAAYLGLETAVNLGQYDKESFRSRMTARFYAADSLRFRRALSDPWLRDHMFSEVLYNIAYDRGGQIMMLLDDRIRTGSGGTFTLHNAVAALCARFAGRGFSRNDFMQVCSEFGAQGVDSVFAVYVDRSDTVPTPETLMSAFNRIDSLAAW